MSPKLVGGLVASHVAVFVVSAVVAREMTIHLRYSANPTGWWWQK